jgi:Lon protease-like protein
MEVALFPLPETVLLKCVPLPLHIFEPRYQQMISESLAGRIPVAVTTIDKRSNYLNRMVIAGYPQVLHDFGDGRLDIVILGEHKICLKKKIQDQPFLMFEGLEQIENHDFSDEDHFECDSLRTLLVRWAEAQIPDPKALEAFKKQISGNEALINFSALAFLKTAESRKHLLSLSHGQEKLEYIMREIGPREISLSPWLKPLRLKD